MGTRADYYVEKKGKLVWLGSIGWDGMPNSIEYSLIRSTTQKDFLAEVKKFFADREDATTPEDGWPWPWEDSTTTDYAYVYRQGKVWVSRFGSPLTPAHEVWEEYCLRKNLYLGVCALERLIDDGLSKGKGVRSALNTLKDEHEKSSARVEALYNKGKAIPFPDMTKTQNIAFRSPRSGLLVFGG